MGYNHEQYKDLEQVAAASERNFGYTLSGAFTLFAIIYSTYTLIAVAAVLLTITIFSPSKLKKLNTAWAMLGNILQQIVTPVIMFLIYITVFLPIALILNICRKNTMLRYNTAASSYWLHKDPPTLPEPLKYQF